MWAYFILLKIRWGLSPPLQRKVWEYQKVKEKKSRKKLIDEIFEEEKELYEIFSTCRQ